MKNWYLNPIFTLSPLIRKISRALSQLSLQSLLLSIIVSSPTHRSRHFPFSCALQFSLDLHIFSQSTKNCNCNTSRVEGKICKIYCVSSFWNKIEIRFDSFSLSTAEQNGKTYFTQSPRKSEKEYGVIPGQLGKLYSKGFID